MARLLTLNFKGAPPTQGGGTDIVPADKYRLVVAKTSDPGNNSSTGKPMVVINFKIARGDQKGKRLRDQFVLPHEDGAQMVGLQRLHACLLALGVKVPADKKFKIDMDSLVGRQCDADVVDGELPAQGGRAARKVSQIETYVIPGQKTAADDDDEDEEESESDDDEDSDESEDDDDEEEEEEEEKPAPKAKAKVKAKAAPAKAVKKPARKASKSDDDDEDDEDGDDFPF